MSDSGLSNCGCCAGLDAETPARIDNPPGQSAIAYRVGVHASFRESFLARLSSGDLPALSSLTTREDDDFTLALGDALAISLDVLTFYQERYANEHYLRTATERRSILEMARLVGYELAPGVAASTRLAFSLQEVPGNPALAAGPVVIPIGARVQSVPGPGEQAQTFETIEEVEAHVEWNAIPAKSTEAWHPKAGDKALWLAGLSTGLHVGDAILIVGQDRVEQPASGQWELRLLTSVEEDRERQRTRVGWDVGLRDLSAVMKSAPVGVSVYALRQRAALFGHNAPEPKLMFNANNLPPSALTDIEIKEANYGDFFYPEFQWETLHWKDFTIRNNHIDLDVAYPKVTPGSWLALVSNDTGSSHGSGFPGDIELYRASIVSFPSRSDFGLAGKITRIVPDKAPKPAAFPLKETLVLAHSELLPVAPSPLLYPLFGSELSLDHPVTGIGAGRALAVSGKRARIRLRKGERERDLALTGGATVKIAEGDSLRLAAAPEEHSAGAWRALTPEEFGQRVAQADPKELRFRLLAPDGREGFVEAPAAAFELVPAEKADDEVQEIAVVGVLADTLPDRGRTSLPLSMPLEHCYDRDTARVNANVTSATHGETVSEVLGSGDARVANAHFALRQAPLTYLRSTGSATGRKSTLELRVNDLLWTEVPSLYGRGPTERVYEIAIDDEARATLRFGDGMEAARLPSGDHNIRAAYRKGVGLAGNLPAGRLTTLLSRPLGVTGVTNPEAASGGKDPEREENARKNAPLSVKTLERVVSIRDYEDFARGYADIVKAHALWIPSGPARGVFLTVAAEGGKPLKADSVCDLQAALHRYGDPLMPIQVVNYREVAFQLRMTIKARPDADRKLVMAEVESRLAAYFGFEARSFGQSVSVDEVLAMAQAVTGVEAAQVIELHRRDKPSPKFVARLYAELPVASVAGAPQGAELLTLDGASLIVEFMP
ncbi:putative baseplate assembly protein [Azotobacter chroococcum]|uniref:putative baseplate assembly protein n=1 Tax=Azotobacter chroococcum TaxID=353 RepID=UPI00103AC73C|nr:putative baseplate assembly protein [Azotobacter chroococcum]TBW39872.1 putative baseplate assembly protein [Azotobacter chroococcum]